jgi:predicted RecA/RadA family phage recombinase
MRDFWQPGMVVGLVMPHDVLSGEGVIVGQLFGVATTDGKTGQIVECLIEGVVALPRAPGSAWAAGAKVSWDATAKVVALSGDLSIGLTTTATISTDTTPVQVKLIPSIVLPAGP